MCTVRGDGAEGRHSLWRMSCPVWCMRPHHSPTPCRKCLLQATPALPPALPSSHSSSSLKARTCRYPSGLSHYAGNASDTHRSFRHSGHMLGKRMETECGALTRAFHPTVPYPHNAHILSSTSACIGIGACHLQIITSAPQRCCHQLLHPTPNPIPDSPPEEE